jgi:hypothetical protein
VPSSWLNQQDPGRLEKLEQVDDLGDEDVEPWIANAL